jgi:hypothetical protein
MVIDEVQNEFPHDRTSGLIGLICRASFQDDLARRENSFFAKIVSSIVSSAWPPAAFLLAPRFRRPAVGVWQFDRDVPRRADHAITAVGIAAAFEGFQQKKEFFGEHLRIPLGVIWMLV